jgi:hypothetical protein
VEKGLDYLGYVADEHRKNLGERPRWFLIFEYTIDLAQPQASLTQRKPVLATNLFLPQSGYYESAINTLDSLRDFLNQVDVLTFARLHGNGVTVGGRKLWSGDYRNINVEHVATLWQAAQKIRAQIEDLDVQWSQRVAALLRTWNDKIGAYKHRAGPDRAQVLESGLRTSRVLLRDSDLSDEAIVTRVATELALIDAETALVEQYVREWREFGRQTFLNKAMRSRVDRLGFSLDPTYDYQGLSKVFFEQLRPALTELTSPPFTAQDLQQITEDLVQHKADSFERLVATLRASSNRDIQALGQDMNDDALKYQTGFKDNYEVLARVVAQLTPTLDGLVRPMLTIDTLHHVQHGLTRHDVAPLMHLTTTLRQHDSKLGQSSGNALYKAAQAYHLIDDQGTPLKPRDNYAVFAQVLEKTWLPRLAALTSPLLTTDEIQGVKDALLQHDAAAYFRLTEKLLNDREVRRGLAVGYRGALQHQPALDAVRVHALVDQARLADPGLAEQGHDLALPLGGLRQCLRQYRQLLIAPDKARQPTRHSGLEAAMDGRGAKQLEDFDGLGQTLDRNRPQGVDLDGPLDQP